MNLYSGSPYWLIRNGLESTAAPLARSESCDVVIIGAGVTGALVADSLSAEGIDVVVLDRGIPGLGSTAASTALLQYELDVELGALSKRIGQSNAERAYQLCHDAVGRIERLAGELGGVGFTRRPSLYLASRARDSRRLQLEADVRAAAGLPAEWWPASRVKERYRFASHGAVHSAGAGEIDALALTRGLLSRAAGRGVRVYPRTAMRAYKARGGGVDVTTDRGRGVRARWIVFAIGYELPALVRRDLVKLHSSYAIVTDIVDDTGLWDDGCLVWESARPYTYLRGTGDGRIMLGGEDVPFRDPARRDRLLPEKQRRLERRLARLLPGIVAPTAFAWAGTFAETVDGLPCIGAQPNAPTALFALGYGGNGLPFGVIAAQLLTDVCLGRGNPDAGLFALDRAP